MFGHPYLKSYILTSIRISSANNVFCIDIRKKLLKIYFSLICKTPINIKKLSANTGAQTAKVRGILSVCPNASERSLK